VAEVPNLRRHFIRDDVIEALVKLLDSEDEGIEISYNTCGILSHIGTDGPEVWTVSVPQKDVFAAMVKYQQISAVCYVIRQTRTTTLVLLLLRFACTRTCH
jgi:hypothetical protein